MELTASELWSRVLDMAQSGVPEQGYRTWLSSTRATALSETELVVETLSEFHVGWVESRYGPLLEELTRRVVGRPMRLTFKLGDLSQPPLPKVSLEPLPEQGETAELDSGSRARSSDASARAWPVLNERYTFDRFVVGNNNELAAAACGAVAEKPARMYNPLFLYGGVGLGKTHLMHAIGHTLLEADPDRRVVYVSSEQFTNELVTAIRKGTTADFRSRYRRMDLLLVDDIHFLEGKERTQEEFFHTFNALYDAQRQIVLTSDRPPKELSGLEARLVSRFAWGLVADLKPPDFETRVAILRKKAEDDRLTIDPEVLDFIAHSCTASVRELEGAVIKLLAYSSLTNQEMSVELARTALNAMFGDESGSAPERVTIELVREVVARRWRVRSEALTSKRRTKDVTLPRQVAMYLIKELLDAPLVRIGEAFGGRDHSTVIHSIRKVSAMRDNDADFAKEVEAARAELLGSARS